MAFLRKVFNFTNFSIWNTEIFSDVKIDDTRS